MPWGIGLLILLHLATVFVAAVVIRRSGAYSKGQRNLQLLVCLLLPVLGVVGVVVMAKEALAPIPGPDESRFDRDYLGGG